MGQGRWVRVNLVEVNRGDNIWHLATNLEDPYEVAQLYMRRMWLEEYFRDLKSLLGLRQTQIRTLSLKVAPHHHILKREVTATRASILFTAIMIMQQGPPPITTLKRRRKNG